MRQRASVARLSDEVLVLHPSILKVFMLEERADRFVILEKATRFGVGQSAYEIDRALEGGSLNPGLILRDAGDFNLGPVKLVGVVYTNDALLFTPLGQRILAIYAEHSRVHEVLQRVNEALPNLMAQLGVGLMPSNLTKSAAEATAIARNYVMAMVRSPDVSVDHVSLNQASRIWEVGGAYRTFPFARSRRFKLQVDAKDGAVIGFSAIPKPSLAPVIVGIVVILGTLGFALFLFLR
jgi:hypothetical protein